MNKINILNNNICNNCSKYGHQYHQCKLPIISYGVIAFSYFDCDEIKYIMIRRKDSFGYIDFIRGKYSPYNIEQIQRIIDQMSIYEKEKILVEPFDKLWKMLWSENIGNHYKNEETTSMKKFELIKNGINVNNEIINLENIVKKSNTNWDETEWEFPKGRKNFQEKDIDCAVREFEEETGISKNNLNIIDNLLPFEEIFIGSNHKSYKHKYFVAFINNKDIHLDNFQKSEVSNIECKTINDCLASIRPYNLEKKILITNINKMLKEYRLYS
jgi:8-oxo-dGTP pyrophosphatase MutT (NUDIX family)